MQPKGKLVHCKGHEPIFIQPSFKQPWADVWINWAAKPGRKRMRCGPTLVSLPSAKQDLELTKRCADENPSLDYAEDLEREEIIVTVLEAGAEIHCDKSLSGIPQITTSKDYIDRAEAERMLRFYLEQEHKLSVVRFKWHRPTHGLIVMPM
jgi:hypothetical protein